MLPDGYMLGGNGKANFIVNAEGCSSRDQVRASECLLGVDYDAREFDRSS